MSRMPRHIFVVEVTYLVLLIALFLVYETDDAFRDVLPTLGNIPIQVVWFGAIGAVLAGLGGVFFYNASWDDSYNYWHYSRPLVGGVVGGIGSLLYYVSLVLGTKNAVGPSCGNIRGGGISLRLRRQGVPGTDHTTDQKPARAWCAY